MKTVQSTNWHLAAPIRLAGLAFILAGPSFARQEANPGELPLDQSRWFAAAQTELRAAEYDFRRVDGEPQVWSAPNRAQMLRSRISRGGLEVFLRETGADGIGAEWRLRLRTCAFGRGVESTELGPPVLSAEGARVELRHGTLVEWFTNDPDGLEQGWTIAESPDGKGLLTIGLDLTGGFALRVDADRLGGVFVGRGGEVRLPYRGLVAFDALGAELQCRIEASVRGARIRVDDRGATYPITVDPVLTGPTWSADGDQDGALYGFAAASAGDVNGDGFGDVIVSAPYYDGGQQNEGRVWLYHGAANGLSISSWTAQSNQVGANYGLSVASAGDVNGDGYGDVVVSAPGWDGGESNEGHVWVYHGSPSGLVSFAAFRAESNQAHALYGSSVASAGDVNGDGFDDLVVGASAWDGGEINEGHVWVYHGSPTGLIPFAAFRAESDQPFAEYGQCVASAGDVNGDGYSDVIVGAPYWDGDQLNEGKIWVYHGSPTGLISFAAFRFESDQNGALLGSSVSSAGDVNGDGYDEVLIGAPFYDAGLLDQGKVWAFRGTSLGIIQVSLWDDTGAGAETEYGASVASAGDVNGDGYADILVGAPRLDSGSADVGRAWLHLGAPLGPISTASWSAIGDQADGRLGQCVAGAGDVNGDGYDDVLVAAPAYDLGQVDEGAAWLFHGSPLIGDAYCVASNNSTGSPAGIWAAGSPSAAAGSLTVFAAPVPNAPGIFFHGSNQIQAPFGNGFLCVGGGVRRGAITNGSGFSASYTYDNSDPRHSLVGFAGNRKFQYWFRDQMGGGFGFNTSEAIAIQVFQ